MKNVVLHGCEECDKQPSTGSGTQSMLNEVHTQCVHACPITPVEMLTVHTLHPAFMCTDISATAPSVEPQIRSEFMKETRQRKQTFIKT